MEIWKPVVGYEGLYEISNLGRLKSVSRTVNHSKTGSRKIPEKIKTPTDIKGYFCCYLYRENVGKRFAIHRLVAEAFIPNPENKPEVNHIDGDKHNNNLSNLEWVTPSENMRHALNAGLWSQYERSGPRNPMFGKHHSDEAKKSIGDVHRGLKHSTLAKKKMSKAHLGKPFSDSHKKALSESLKKAKSGFRWVTNGEVSRMVPPDEAKILILSGWRIGRSLNPNKKE